MTTQYLLDTCVLSEFVKPKPERKVIAWLNSVDLEAVFLSAVTLGEIQFGISNRPPSNRRTELEVWLSEALPQQFGDRILALEAETFVEWGKLTAAQKRKGETQSVMDSLITATALEHKLVLVTRNVNDFKVSGLSVFNPWE
ncbi:MAG: type II toxin-antitoxin system VapC family toxin [Anaerolineales bacterium]|nr:type II toxin-antitoxin system VapC family toxin [Anaerolineales bacterium]